MASTNKHSAPQTPFADHRLAIDLKSIAEEPEETLEDRRDRFGIAKTCVSVAKRGKHSGAGSGVTVPTRDVPTITLILKKSCVVTSPSATPLAGKTTSDSAKIRLHRLDPNQGRS